MGTQAGIEQTEGNKARGVGLVLVASRAPFLTASALSAVLASAWCWVYRPASFDWAFAVAAVLGVILVHLGANTINDYFDWDESDRVNKYVTPFSGGSRSRVEGRMSRNGFLFLSMFYFALAAAVGVFLAVKGRIHVITLGLVGAGGGLLYSARPVQLMSRGLGELDIFFMFGPLITLGTGYAIEGSFSVVYFVLGVPLGLLVTAILWINEFPDVEADAAVGKRNLVVRLGTRRARWGLAALYVSFAVSVVTLFTLGVLPIWSLGALACLVLAIRALKNAWVHHNDPKAVVPSQAATIGLQLVAGILLTISVVVDRWLV